TQASEQSSVGRMSVLSAGFPNHVPATMIDRKCGSSQQAIHFAAQGIAAGAYDVVIAGGVESMSRVPMGSNRMRMDDHGPGVRARF
ncbi:3-oxoadipyl-CoA thiolase, partial [Raoultella planticola]|uniref:thiolase family protein n=2 Tax=Pseudomonadota TaxID=1224 RepID=UPI00247FA72F